MKIRVALSVISFALSGWSQTEEKFKARELFFTPPPAATQPTKPAANAGKQANHPKQTQAAKKSTAPSTSKPAQAAEPSRSSEPEVQFVNASSIPLGLRYSILKRQDDAFREVDPESTFRSGDAIRVSVEANDTGYLYIVMKGTSGNWRLLFPSPEIDNGNNRVARGRRYQIPSKNAFVFDEQPGTEKLFLVLTRRPEPDLEKLIYALSSGQELPADTTRPEAKSMIMAENRQAIGDDLVTRLRGRVLARDLVFEKVDEKTPGEVKETAVYVVNHKRSADSRLVVDIQLEHR